MNSNNVISIKDNFIYSESDNELFLMSLENNAYYGLDEIGKRVFEIIQKPINFSEIVQILMNEYEVDEETCKNDLESFLNSLYKANIIDIS
jgi:uncharacterized membrane-anchored protein YitT (DUF2179 family)